MGLTICRLNYLSIMKKYINIGDPSMIAPQPKLMDKYHSTKDTSATTVSVRNYVGTPDSEEMIPLVAPPQLLLESFLQAVSAERLFPLALDNPDNPVLLVDCYLNLGSQITGKCCHVDIKMECKDLVYRREKKEVVDCTLN